MVSNEVDMPNVKHNSEGWKGLKDLNKAIYLFEGIQFKVQQDPGT